MPINSRSNVWNVIRNIIFALKQSCKIWFNILPSVEGLDDDFLDSHIEWFQELRITDYFPFECDFYVDYASKISFIASRIRSSSQ